MRPDQNSHGSSSLPNKPVAGDGDSKYHPRYHHHESALCTFWTPQVWSTRDARFVFLHGHINKYYIRTDDTTVRLTTGSVAVFSPVTLTSEVRETVDSLGGKVKYIAALDLEHHLHLTAWKKAYPDAEVIGPEGLWEKRQSVPEFKDTPFQHVFTKEKNTTQGGPQKISDEFDAEFDKEYVHGHGSRELIFLHKPSKTLIEADLLFNLPAREQYSRTNEAPNSGILTRFVIPLLSTTPPATWHKRFAWYILSPRDRAAFTTSMRRIDTWDFSRLIPCHGDVIESDAKGVFRTVMEWFLGDGKKGS